MAKIAVLIPCYNEEKTIEKVVWDYKKILKNAKIYVFDNNSTDKTALLAKKAGAIVKKEPHQGKGNVIRSMFNTIKADCYLLVDGDDACPSKTASKMCNLILHDHVDMVIGDRLSSNYFKENKRLFHGFGNRLVRLLVHMLFGGTNSDVMSGYRALSKELVKKTEIISRGFEVDTEITIRALCIKSNIVDVPIKYKSRQGTYSKLHTFSDGIKIIKMIFRLHRKEKPLVFFILISITFSVIAAIIWLVAKNIFL